MHTPTPTPTPTASPLDLLSRLVVKDGVSLGGLSADELNLALAWVWVGLPVGIVMNEPGINAVLKAQLAGPAVWLHTDHVELRRWLVDAGWLQRDGYGREYRRAAAAPYHAVPHHTALTDVMRGLDTTTWTAECRHARVAGRVARRQRWEQQQARASTA